MSKHTLGALGYFQTFMCVVNYCTYTLEHRCKYTLIYHSSTWNFYGVCVHHLTLKGCPTRQYLRAAYFGHLRRAMRNQENV